MQDTEKDVLVRAKEKELAEAKEQLKQQVNLVSDCLVSCSVHVVVTKHSSDCRKLRKKS